MTRRQLVDTAPIERPAGGYAYLPSTGFASDGVIASAGMAIERALLATPLPWPSGIERIRRQLDDLGRPLEALCALELRSPSAVSMATFRDFNERYLALLDRYGLRYADAVPIARTNVVPTGHPPAEPMLVGFSYTTPRATSAPPCLAITGVAELADDGAFPDDVIRHGDTSPEALLHKASWVAAEVAARITALGSTWKHTDRANVYCAHPMLFKISRQVLDPLGVRPAHGLVWHDSTPPVRGLELEIDVRRHLTELMLED